MKKRAAAVGAPAVRRPPDGLEVWLDDRQFGQVHRLGRLHHTRPNAVRFEYARDWLRHPLAFALDPELGLSDGSFYPRDSNFGIFLDSCPDRWGQTLMKRREAVAASLQGRTRRELTLWDFFLGVQDVTRMGALRFSPMQSDRQYKNGDAPQFIEGTCLAAEALSAPPLTQVGELQTIALELTRKGVEDLNLLHQSLKVLVAPGASLGGARPKANVQDADGRFWIAKFPAADDEHDWAQREMLLHRMASEFGIRTAPSRLERIGNGYHTFLTVRFDRHHGSRRFFTSAMALLAKTDTEDASYLELAEFASNNASERHVDEDLRELFRRVLFNVASCNRDDHLRNHGFIRSPEGWRLAPAYDMNPTTKRDEHVLALDDANHMPDLRTVLETAQFYRLTPAAANAERDKLFTVLGRWESIAKRIGIGAEDRAHLQGCFRTN